MSLFLPTKPWTKRFELWKVEDFGRVISELDLVWSADPLSFPLLQADHSG